MRKTCTLIVLLFGVSLSACQIDEIEFEQYIDDIIIGENDCCDDGCDCDCDCEIWDTEWDTEPECDPGYPGITADESGWVDADCNAYGIQGAWYAYSDIGDGGESDIDLDVYPWGEVCAYGYVSQVYDEEWGTYWGAGFGLDLCLNGPDDVPPDTVFGMGECPRDLSQIIGFSMAISGVSEKEFRVGFAEVGQSEFPYIVTEPTGDYEAFLFEDAEILYDPEAPPIDPQNIQSLRFQVATDPVSGGYFEICIYDIMPVVLVK